MFISLIVIQCIPLTMQIITFSKTCREVLLFILYYILYYSLVTERALRHIFSTPEMSAHSDVFTKTHKSSVELQPLTVGLPGCLCFIDSCKAKAGLAHASIIHKHLITIAHKK